MHDIAFSLHFLVLLYSLTRVLFLFYTHPEYPENWTADAAAVNFFMVNVSACQVFERAVSFSLCFFALLIF
jgi:hypothetical protein